MSVGVRFVTDPACPWSWSAEPWVRRLMVEFGDALSWTWVMGGLARDYGGAGDGGGAGTGGPDSVHADLVARWLEVADRGRMPIDPRLWTDAPIASTYPACMAVKAAAEQGGDEEYAYLRAVREGLLCFRRKLDTTEALVEEARRAGLDAERFRIDLGSHAIVEAFGADLEEARAAPEPVTFPTATFTGADGAAHRVVGYRPYEDYREAAEAAGARRTGEPPLGVVDALRRFGRMATAEVEAVCGLAAPPAAAELWRLASEWRVKPVRVLTGYLWELA